MLNLACGYLYGVTRGLLVTVLTATAGIIVAHAVCRHLLAARVRALLLTSERTRALAAVIAGPAAFRLGEFMFHRAILTSSHRSFYVIQYWTDV